MRSVSFAWSFSNWIESGDASGESILSSLKVVPFLDIPYNGDSVRRWYQGKTKKDLAR
jgi:hypothetical protein